MIFGGAFIGGAAIRSFFIGLFGFAAYAYAAGLLILGILRIKRVRATARVARILLFSGIIALALLLLHQISTNAVFKGQSYGGYLGRCYNGMSVGGVLFGLIAYPVHFILGGVVSYIVYVLGLIALLLFAFRILPPGARAGAEGPPEVRPRQHFARDRVGARAVYENENRLLFNMELTGSHAPAQQGTASSMPEGARVTSAAEPPLTAFSDLHRGVPLTSDAAAPQQPSAPQGGSRAAYDALMGSQSPFANGNQPAGQVLAPPPSSALYPSSPAPTGYGGGASYGGGSYAPPPQQQQTAYANPYPPAAPVAYVSPYQTASAGGAGGLPNPFSAGAYGGEIPPVFDPSQSPIVGVRTSRRPSMVVHDTTQKPAPAAARQEQTAVNNMARFIDGDARSRELNVNKKPGEAAARSNVSATLAPDLRSRIMDGDAMSNAL
ncbi:MAG: hypothetical protein LBM78_00300, partial [Clostridiales bacterium]|nr:hypothetical protein [Clostridiales bacterium]